MTTFGFELEFGSNVDQLIGLLTDRGFADQDARLHPYHCECDNCANLTGVRFRAQRDSSCGGEIISGIFTSNDWDSAIESMRALQEAALDVDASIDVNCGMHVHIGDADGTDLATRESLSMAWLGLEPILWEHVAGSVWATRRSAFNSLVSQAMADIMQTANVWHQHGLYPVPERDMAPYSLSFKQDYIEQFRSYLRLMPWDRHSDLARANHGGVSEIRIFNATRVAWRIEMACRLSVAICDPEVAERFATLTDEFLFGDLEKLHARMQTLRDGYRRRGRQYSMNDRPLVPTLPISMAVFMETVSEFDERLGELLTKQTGYTAARKEAGIFRSSISNEIDLADWNHQAVLAALQPS